MDGRGMRMVNLPERFDRFVGAPAHRLFAAFDDQDAARAGLGEVRTTMGRVREDDIWVFVGEEGARRLDASGRVHGLSGRVVRFLQQQLSGDVDYLRLLDKGLRHGGVVVAVLVEPTKVTEMAAVLRRHGGRLLAEVAHWDYVPLGTAA